ncbi:MAG: Transcriptional regulator, AcrR family, partial [uncultured Nocardioidaceae bacterium]
AARRRRPTTPAQGPSAVAEPGPGREDPRLRRRPGREARRRGGRHPQHRGRRRRAGRLAVPVLRRPRRHPARPGRAGHRGDGRPRPGRPRCPDAVHDPGHRGRDPGGLRRGLPRATGVRDDLPPRPHQRRHRRVLPCPQPPDRAGALRPGLRPRAAGGGRRPASCRDRRRDGRPALPARVRHGHGRRPHDPRRGVEGAVGLPRALREPRRAEGRRRV